MSRTSNVKASNVKGQSIGEDKSNPAFQEIDRMKSELAFERQCNAELGRRNRKYLKLIDKFDAHRVVMEGMVEELSSKINHVLNISANTDRSELNELVNLLRSSRDICTEMKRLNDQTHFTIDRSDNKSSDQRRSRRGSSAVISLDTLRRSSQYTSNEIAAVLATAPTEVAPSAEEDQNQQQTEHLASSIIFVPTETSPMPDKSLTKAAPLIVSLTSSDTMLTLQENDTEAPLFEHFLMIGCTEQDAREFGLQLRQEVSTDSLTDRIKRTMTGIFASQRQISASNINNNINNSNISISTNTPIVSPESTSTTSNFFKFQSPALPPAPPLQRSISNNSNNGSNSNNNKSVADGNNNAGENKGYPMPLAVPTVSVKAVQSWMGSMMVSGSSKKPPTVASPEPMHLSVVLEGETEVSPISQDLPEDTVNKTQQVQGSNEETSSIDWQTAAETDEEEIIHLSESANRGSLAGLSSLTESIKSTSSSAGSTLSKLGGSFFTKINTVPFSLTPPRGSTDASNNNNTNANINFNNANKIPMRSLSTDEDGTATSEQIETMQETAITDTDGLTHLELQINEVSTSTAQISPKTSNSNTNSTNSNSATFTSQCLFSDLKAGKAVVQPTIIFRYPENIPPPTNEVSNFCLPAGSSLQAVPDQSEDALMKDILYPRASTRHTQRSMVFWFEDRNSNPLSADSDKLYGICLITPRVLVVDHSQHSNNANNNSNSNESNNNSSSNNSNTRQVFIAHTCYAFITRYPFFDFFFRILQDILAIEKLHRMEMSSAMRQDLLLSSTVDSNNINHNSHSNSILSQYIPSAVLLGVLRRLADIRVPKISGSINYQPHDDLPIIEFSRKRPRYGWTEHDMDLAEWCLPGLFTTLPVEMILWSLSFILCEAKFIITSKEPGLISVVANGLQYLLRPLEWAGPFIPIVPAKVIEFVESPVPIICGVPLDTYLQVSDIQSRCQETEHLLTVILDIDRQEILVPNDYMDRVPCYCMPSMESLVEKLHHILQVIGMQGMGSNSMPDKEIAYIVSDRVATHIEALCVMAKSAAESQRIKLDRLHEEKLQQRHAQKIEEVRRLAELTTPQNKNSCDLKGDQDGEYHDDGDDEGADNEDADNDEETSRAEQLRLYYKQLVELNNEGAYSGSASNGMDLRALFSAAMSSSDRRTSAPATLPGDAWQSINHLDFTSSQEEFMINFVSTQMYSSFSSTRLSTSDSA